MRRPRSLPHSISGEKGRRHRPFLAVPSGPPGHPECTPSADVQCSPAILHTVLDDHTRVASISSALSSPSSHHKILSLYTTEDPRSVSPVSGMHPEQTVVVVNQDSTIGAASYAGKSRAMNPLLKARQACLHPGQSSCLSIGSARKTSSQTSPVPSTRQSAATRTPESGTPPFIPCLHKHLALFRHGSPCRPMASSRGQTLGTLGP